MRTTPEPRPRRLSRPTARKASATSRSLADYLHDFWAPGTAIIVIAILLARVMVVVHGDISTGIALAGSTSGPAVALVAVISMVPILVAAVTGVAWAATVWGIRERGSSRWWLIAPITFWLASIEVASISELVGALVLGVLAGIFWERGSKALAGRPASPEAGRRTRPSADKETQTELLGVLLATALIALYLNAVISSDAWLPSERVSVSGQQLIAYVVGADSKWTTLLKEESRTIWIVRTEQVDAREICRREGAHRSAARELAEQFRGQADPIPRCDSLSTSPSPTLTSSPSPSGSSPAVSP